MISLIRAASENLVWVCGPTSARPVHVFMVCAVGRIMRKTMVQAAANYKEQGSYYGSIEMTTDTQLRERGKRGRANVYLSINYVFLYSILLALCHLVSCGVEGNCLSQD